MDSTDRDDVSTVLLVEVVKIRGVLEVVRVNLSVLGNYVRLNIVGEFNDLKCDFLLCEDILCNRKDLGVRRGGGGDLYRLSLECIIIDRAVKAVSGVLDGADNRAVVF